MFSKDYLFGKHCSSRIKVSLKNSDVKEQEKSATIGMHGVAEEFIPKVSLSVADVQALERVEKTDYSCVGRTER